MSSNGTSGNLNHPVTQHAQAEMHKILALVMYKLGHERVEVTLSDLEAFSRDDKHNIAIRYAGESLICTLLTDEESNRLAREEGGLPL